jgi:23S rRNA (pseudouridine1915-N3)-methyltransferase
MQWHLFAIGKPRLAFARDGIGEYAKRLRPFCTLNIEYLKAATRDDESAALLRRSEGMLRILLDERGDPFTSRALAAQISTWEQSRSKSIALLIGGAGGHTDSLRTQADKTWSLSPLTIQHELAQLLLLEQLYRAYTIKANLPYHRD